MLLLATTCFLQGNRSVRLWSQNIFIKQINCLIFATHNSRFIERNKPKEVNTVDAALEKWNAVNIPPQEVCTLETLQFNRRKKLIFHFALIIHLAFSLYCLNFTTVILVSQSKCFWMSIDAFCCWWSRVYLPMQGIFHTFHCPVCVRGGCTCLENSPWLDSIRWCTCAVRDFLITSSHFAWQTSVGNHARVGWKPGEGPAHRLLSPFCSRHHPPIWCAWDCPRIKIALH